jgi:hypothetical protein
MNLFGAPAITLFYADKFYHPRIASTGVIFEAR